jgi:hypothetical protein
MFNKLLQLFNFNSSEKESESEDQTDSHNSISLVLQEDGQFFIKIEISSKELKNGEKFGECLFLLNEGYLVQSILDLLNEMVIKDPTLVYFMDKTITKWSEKIKDSEQISKKNVANKPIISPSQFYSGIGK